MITASIPFTRVASPRNGGRKTLNTGMLISSHSVQLTATHSHTQSHTPTRLHTAVSCSLSKQASQQFINVLINIHAAGEAEAQEEQQQHLKQIPEGHKILGIWSGR